MSIERSREGGDRERGGRERGGTVSFSVAGSFSANNFSLTSRITSLDGVEVSRGVEEVGRGVVSRVKSRDTADSGEDDTFSFSPPLFVFRLYLMVLLFGAW